MLGLLSCLTCVLDLCVIAHVLPLVTTT